MNTLTAPVENTAPLLDVQGLKTHFPIRRGVIPRTRGYVHAVDGVSFSIKTGETLGLVGESGSGKSTLGKSILRLIEPTAGTIKIHGQDITHLSKARMFPYRREMQMVFQDPYSSLNPRIPVGRIVAETLQVHGIASGKKADEIVRELFSRVGLRAAQLIGDGLYGVDLKETSDGIFVVEVNDNPNIDHGVEDRGEKDQVWIELTRWFIDRLEA